MIMLKYYSSIFSIFALLLIFSGITAVDSAAQDREPLADEMRNLLKSEPFNVGILLQSTANFSLTDDGFNNGRRFGLGATRLRFGGSVDGGFDLCFTDGFSPNIERCRCGSRVQVF